jgi:hypothetical protein
MPDIERSSVDTWQAMAMWRIGEWSDAQYADWLEAHPDHDPDDPIERAIIDRLRATDAR